jgi:hypothetical protein
MFWFCFKNPRKAKNGYNSLSGRMMHIAIQMTYRQGKSRYINDTKTHVSLQPYMSATKITFIIFLAISSWKSRIHKPKRSFLTIKYNQSLYFLIPVKMAQYNVALWSDTEYNLYIPCLGVLAKGCPSDANDYQIKCHNFYTYWVSFNSEEFYSSIHCTVTCPI